VAQSSLVSGQRTPDIGDFTKRFLSYHDGGNRDKIARYRDDETHSVLVVNFLDFSPVSGFIAI